MITDSNLPLHAPFEYTQIHFYENVGNRKNEKLPKEQPLFLWEECFIVFTTKQVMLRPGGLIAGWSGPLILIYCQPSSCLNECQLGTVGSFFPFVCFQWPINSLYKPTGKKKPLFSSSFNISASPSPTPSVHLFSGLRRCTSYPQTLWDCFELSGGGRKAV